MTSTAHTIFLLDSAALQGLIRSHLEGQGQTWAKPTAPTAFGGAQSFPGLEELGRVMHTEERWPTVCPGVRARTLPVQL